MQMANDYGSIIHFLRFASPTHTVLKLGLTSYPAILRRKTRARKYHKELAPMKMKMERNEAIRIYCTRAKAQAIESVLHIEMRAKYGNAYVNGVTSTEIYATKHVQEILDLLSGREQQTIAQLQALKLSFQQEYQRHGAQ